MTTKNVYIVYYRSENEEANHISIYKNKEKATDKFKKLIEDNWNSNNSKEKTDMDGNTKEECISKGTCYTGIFYAKILEVETDTDKEIDIY